jgi:hypothetical protein
VTCEDVKRRYGPKCLPLKQQPWPFSALALTDLLSWNAVQGIINVLTAARPGVLLTLLADYARTHI